MACTKIKPEGSSPSFTQLIYCRPPWHTAVRGCHSQRLLPEAAPTEVAFSRLQKLVRSTKSPFLNLPAKFNPSPPN